MAPGPGVREPLAGPDTGPQAPYPVRLNGPIIKGFGRGSKELGIATANIPLEGLEIGGCSDLDSGVYFGWAGVDLPGASIGDKMSESLDPRANVYPMVMSIGWNPFYKNTVRSVEVHIMHHFTADFYGHHLNLVILGFIRPEYDYSSKERLIADIEEDIAVSERSLARPPYLKHSDDPYLTTFPSDAGGTKSQPGLVP